ncbi:TPA: hypothetical protein ACOEHG_005120 [Enterobacter ludwigii]
MTKMTNTPTKAALILSIAERVAMTAVNLAHDSGLNKKDAGQILHLAHEAIDFTAGKGFGGQDEPVVNQELIDKVASILSYIHIKSELLGGDSDIHAQVKLLIPAVDALIERQR